MMCDDDKLPEVSIDVCKLLYAKCAPCPGKARGVTRIIMPKLVENRSQQIQF